MKKLLLLTLSVLCLCGCGTNQTSSSTSEVIVRNDELVKTALKNKYEQVSEFDTYILTVKLFDIKVAYLQTTNEFEYYWCDYIQYTSYNYKGGFNHEGYDKKDAVAKFNLATKQVGFML